MDNSDFDKHFNDINKNINRTFTVAGIMGVIMTLAIIAVMVTCIYLAIKKWG
jgi:type IV secretory pathway component VirB8